MFFFPVLTLALEKCSRVEKKGASQRVSGASQQQQRWCPCRLASAKASRCRYSAEVRGHQAKGQRRRGPSYSHYSPSFLFDLSFKVKDLMGSFFGRSSRLCQQQFICLQY